jgi:LPS-assembly protein
MRRAAALSAIALLAVGLPSAWAADEKQRLGGSGNPVQFSADEVQYDQELGLVIAKGHVELSQGAEIVLADTVTYNQKTDTVTASGNVSLLEPTGDIVFSDYVELHNDLRDGFIKDIRMLMSDGSRMAGNTARRVNGTRIEARRIVYSPCDLCRDDPSKAPLWQITAEKMVDDKELQVVEYRDAYLEVAGFPLLYFPYLSHPDPSVKRQSGFLAPTFGGGSSIGFRTDIPYYWVIGPDKDATFRPIFTTKGGVVADGEYRQRWGFGTMTVDGSIAFDSESQSTDLINPPPPTPGLRGHLFGDGEFDLNQDWRTGFDIQTASDLTYLLRYHFPYPNSNFLSNRVYAENFTDQSYFNVSAFGYESINPEVSTNIQPFVLPSVNYSWTSQPDSLGGRWTVNGNGLDIVRLEGSDIRRLSAGGSWRLPFDGAIGDRFTFTGSVRGDTYDTDNLLLSGSDTIGRTEVAGRVFPQAALDWHYPWVRRGGTTYEIFEPIVALIAAPNGGNPGKIPNEDSQGFEFDETSLFVPNRFPGYDRVDSGQRADYGFRAGIYNDRYGSTTMLFGESYSLQNDDNFLPGSGLGDHRSDYVGRFVVSPTSYLDFLYRYRLNKDDLRVERQEASIATGPTNLRVRLSYINYQALPGVTNLETKGNQISANVTADLTRYWSIALTDTRNIGDGGTIVTTSSGNAALLNNSVLSAIGTTINSGVSVTYRDECASVTTSLVQSGISVGDVKPGYSIMVTFALKNLGEFGEKAASFGGSGSLSSVQ